MIEREVVRIEEEPARGLFDGSPGWFAALLVLIFAVGLGVRLYNLSAPPVDFHPTRQLHSALIARGMFLENRPEVPGWQREMALTQWRTEGVIEPQVFERVAAWGYALVGAADLRLPRLIAILFWALAAGFTAAIAARISGKGGALAAALLFLAWPYGVIASRAFQPEPLFIALMCAGLWSALRWLEKPRWGWAVAAGLLCGLAVYIKAVAIFFVAPGLLVLVLYRSGSLRGAVRSPQVWVMALLSLLPYTIYYVDGLYLRGYLTGQLAQRFFPSMWVDSAFYLRWVSNLGRVFPVGLLLISLAGLFTLRRPVHRALLLALWAGYVLYGLTLPHHISTHDYYHLPLFPQVALGFGAAAESVFRQLRVPRRAGLAAASALLVAGLAFYGYEARTQMKRSGAAEQAAAWAEAGRLAGERGSAVALVDDYGVGLKYYAWINPQIWPTADDIRFQEESGQSFDFDRFFVSQVEGRDFFIVSPPAELDLQPRLKEVLDSRYLLVQRSDRLLIYDLRTAAKP